MIDDPPSATPMPKQPVAAATNPAAPWPPADSLPVFVPPSVMDPVSNLDFLPVDDAFALEFRSESIEQLVGGDALRRGESERIEAGRSEDERRRTSPGVTVCACRARSTSTPATHAPRWPRTCTPPSTARSTSTPPARTRCCSPGT